MCSVVVHRNKAQRFAILLSLWVYTYALFYFVPLIIPSTTLLMYIWLVGIDILAILNCMNLSIRFCKFVLFYVLIALVNVVTVSYPYYVAIDAFSGLAVFLPALLIISSSSFDLKCFLNMWYKFAIIMTGISPIAIVLLQHKVIDYGVFTYLNLPNAIIFSYNIMVIKKGNFKKKISLFLATLNFLIILAFGGRMAAFAAAFAIFLGYMLSSFVKPVKKTIFLFSITVTAILILSNLATILQFVQIILSKYNLSSRSFSLLVEQLQTKESEIYMSGRNVIYSEIINYIIDRLGIPGGFGISLNVSNGQFYHPHNLFLQLAVMFGVVGGLLFIILIIYKLLKMKRNKLTFEYQFTLLIIIEYLVISLTGGSILNHFAAIIGIGMVFFYRGNARSISIVP